MKKKQRKYSKITETPEELRKVRRANNRSKFPRTKYKLAEKFKPFTSENFTNPNKKSQTRKRKKAKQGQLRKIVNTDSFLASKQKKTISSLRNPKQACKTGGDKTLKIPLKKSGPIPKKSKGQFPVARKQNGKKSVLTGNTRKTREAKRPAKVETTETESASQLGQKDQKKRTKCVRHNSEGNQNPLSKMNSLFKLKRREKFGMGREFLIDEKLITDLKILNKTSDYSVKNFEEFPEKNSNIGAIIRFDSMSQSASIVSMESQQKSRKFNENLLSMGSVLLNNLTQTFENSRKENASFVTTRSKNSFDFQPKPKHPIDVNFFSQVNNKIIKEESQDLFSIGLSLAEETSTVSRDCFLNNSGTHESLEILSPEPPSFPGKLTFCLASQRKSSKLARVGFLDEMLRVIFLRRMKCVFGFFRVFSEECGEVEEKNLRIHPQDTSDSRTKLMIKNIPNKYNIAQLAKLYNSDFQDRFDFLYLVMDAKTNCNQGYAFINMVPGSTKYDFFRRFNGSSWPHSRSGKKCRITYAKLQNKDPLDQVFLDKYYQECHKYWVPPKVILSKFPYMGPQLNMLEKRREMLLKNRQLSNMEFPPFYGAPFGPRHPHFPFLSYPVFIREQSAFGESVKRI